MSDLISAVRLTPVTAPRAAITCGHIIVELETTAGLVGVGEMSDFQHLPMYHVDVPELQRTLESLLVGRDPREATLLELRMRQAFPSGEFLYDKASLIRCGIDIALWDLRAKTFGVNVAELLGGRLRPSIPIAYPVFRAQHAEDVERNLDIVAEQVARGFRRFRVYVGRELDLDARFLDACVERFGSEIALKSLDFSNLLTAEAASRFIQRTEHIGYEFVEAPARSGDLDGLRRVRETTLMPVSEHAVSERHALALVSSGGVDILNVGLFVLGGLTPAQRVLSVASAAGVPCLIGTTQELSIGTAAAAHLGTCGEVVEVASDPVGPLLYRRDVVTSALEFAESALIPPSGPGLGVEIDPVKLAEARSPLTWTDQSVVATIDRTGGPS